MEAINAAAEPFPDEASHLTLPGAAGALEVVVDHPSVEDKVANLTAIVCPGSAEAGATLHHKVVQIIERSFRELGATTVRFNFRGCGESEGEYAEGFGETDDLLTVFEWVRENRPLDEIWIGGYQCGAFIAQRACQSIKAGHLVSVSPPLHRFDFAALTEPACPWLVVGAALDQEVTPDQVHDWVETLESSPRLVLIEEADETFHRRLMDLRGVLKNGIRRGRA